MLKFDFNGNPLAIYSPAIQDRGTDWVDLAADLHTIRYTSEGNTIFQYDLATNTQLANFNATGLPAEPAYAHRILSDGGELVAATSALFRLDKFGNVVQTYTIPGTSLLFAMNLDPDGTSFWTADYFDHDIFRVDISTGNILTTFNDGGSGVLGGLAVLGERTAPPVPLPPSALLFGSGLISMAGAGFGWRKFFKTS